MNEIMPVNRLLHDVNTTQVATLVMQQLEYAICLQCCCVYTDVETATCGHSLCSSCWRSQRVCCTCMVRATQTQRKRNIPLQTLATHSQVLLNTFKKLFHITVDEYLNTSSNNSEEKVNATVTNWFQNSQNKFIHPSAELHTEIVDLHFDGLAKSIQKSHKTESNTFNVIYKPLPQIDWDKIETLSNSQVVRNNEDKHCRNPQDTVYTHKNPRRSSRKKDPQTDIETPSMNKGSDRSIKTDEKSELAKNNWNRVKKMRKEFSRLNKIHRNKLNVSIENIKKSKSSTKLDLKDNFVNLPNTPYVIDEESLMILTHEQKSQRCIEDNEPRILNNIDIEQQNMNGAVFQESTNVNSDQNYTLVNRPFEVRDRNFNTGRNISNTNNQTHDKIPFLKRDKLCYDFCKRHDNLLKQMKCAACQTTDSDNIFVDIRTGKSLINIVIKGENDIQVKRQTYIQIENTKDKVVNISPVTQQKKDMYVDSSQKLVQISDVSQEPHNLLEKQSIGYEIVAKGSKSNLTQLDTDSQKHATVVENFGEVGSTGSDADLAELDIFNNTPQAQDDVHFLKQADIGPSEIVTSAGEKRVCEGDILIPSAKRVCLGDYSSRPSLDSQSNSAPAQQLYSENVFSLSEKQCYQSANQQLKPATINTNLETNQYKTNGNKNDHDLIMVESISTRSIIEESQHPVVVPVVTNALSTINSNNAVKTIKDFTNNYPVEHTASTHKIHDDCVAIESFPTNEVPLRTRTLDTPLSMTNFVNSIEHNSTPLAKKSLRFERATLRTDSVDATLCPTNLNGPNTQEREFMSIESIPRQSAVAVPVCSPCIAGSNLISSESAQLKLICVKLGWTFLETYSPTLTHLVVAVDEENKAQRTVKYMCALAGGKWVVSFAWAERCAVAGHVVPEMAFEALDLTGAPGPRRSRTATRPLFTDFTFYCMPPFSLLDVATLEGMLKASGARIVESAAAARADGREPHLVLAESDQSQTPENRFTFIAMKLSVVPVSVDWLLSSLGAYELYPLRDSLLCPVTLAMGYARHWLPPLLDGETDSDLADESVPPSP